MKIKILDKEEAKFILEGISETTANTIRRLIIEEVPTLAIEDVSFIKNESAIYDEFLAHRLGLIPLKTDLKSYTLPENCKCKGKGCVHCRVILKLKAKGPAIAYAGDFKSKDPKVKAVHPKMPIVKLLKKQELAIECTAVLGKGKDHTKFNPGLVFYQGVPGISLGKARDAEKIVKICPRKVFEVSGGKLKIKNKMKCNLCMACAEEDKNVEVKASKKDFIVIVEPFGQLSAKEMLNTAIDIFDKKLNEFSKLLGKVK